MLRIKIIVSTFVVLFTVLCVFGQEVQFSFNNGNQSSYGLEDVKHMTFEGDLLNLEMLDGMVYTWNIETVSNFIFDTQTGVNNTLTDANKVYVFKPKWT